MKTPFKRLGALALAAALAAGTLALGGTAAHAAEHDKLPFEMHKNVPYLGPITMPVNVGSMSDRQWLEGGAITTEGACAAGMNRTRSKLVWAENWASPNGVEFDARDSAYASVNRTNARMEGWGLDGLPFELTLAGDASDNNVMLPGGFHDPGGSGTDAGAVPVGDFWFVLTCDASRPNPTATVDQVGASYFAVKLENNGTHWRVAGSGAEYPAAVDLATETSLTATATNIDGRVTFTASVSADSTVTGGTVQFVNTANNAVLASAPVLAGQAQATSTAPIDPVTPVSVKAVYSGVAGFTGSESGTQQVTGVRPAAPGTGEGDLELDVPVNNSAPAGAVVFTAAAAANLGTGAWSGNSLTASGSIEGARVTDSRADKSAAWSVNGSATAFTTTAAPIAGKATEIPATALTWAPAVTEGTTLPAGASAGERAAFGQSRTLLSWAAGSQAEGTVESSVGAELSLNFDGELVPGAYSAKLTLTLV